MLKISVLVRGHEFSVYVKLIIAVNRYAENRISSVVLKRIRKITVGVGFFILGIPNPRGSLKLFHLITNPYLGRILGKAAVAYIHPEISGFDRIFAVFNIISKLGIA